MAGVGNLLWRWKSQGPEGVSRMCPQSKSDSLRSQGLIRLFIYSIDNYCKRDCVSGTIEIQWSIRQIRFLA